MTWEAVPAQEIPQALDAVKEGRCVSCYGDIDATCLAEHGFYCCTCDDAECQ